MEKVMGDLQPRCILVYIGNIKMYSPSLQRHMVDFDAALARLEAANFKVSVSKVRLILSEVFVMGHFVSAQAIHPSFNM